MLLLLNNNNNNNNNNKNIWDSKSQTNTLWDAWIR